MPEVVVVTKVVTDGGQDPQYEAVYGHVSRIIYAAKESAARSVNAAMTAGYWLIGHRIVEFEQLGENRAKYGTALIERLASDLTRRFGRSFSRQNLQHMRMFYLVYPPDQIRQAPSGTLTQPPHLPIRQTPSGKFDVPSTVSLRDLLTAFPLPWSAYVRLMSVRS